MTMKQKQNKLYIRDNLASTGAGAGRHASRARTSDTPPNGPRHYVTPIIKPYTLDTVFPRVIYPLIFFFSGCPIFNEPAARFGGVIHRST